MDSSVYRILKHDFINHSNLNNRSTVELCITEMSSGNFEKAISLSEEIIKSDINDSIGWASKALAQANIFDYGNNLFLLKSSLMSLEEFREKTTLSEKEIINVESFFQIAFLERTIGLVNHRIEEVIRLRKQALAEKKKAQAAAIGAALSAYAATQSKSDVGKILGYGGAIAGAAAASNFSSNANQLTEASKGVFGVAVANISMSVDIAITLKNNYDLIDRQIQHEAATALQNWINVLAFLYQQVIENLVIYAEDIKKKSVFSKDFLSATINMIHSPEATQFIYLSKLTGIEHSIPAFNDIVQQMEYLKTADLETIKGDVKKMVIVIIALFVIGYFAAAISPKSELAKTISGLMFIAGFVSIPVFNNKPIGQSGVLKRAMDDFIRSMKEFKITSDQLIFENMISSKKTSSKQVTV